MAVSIRFEHVTKCFGDLRVVDDVDLSVEPGELFFLLGPSGCGKTTLLRCIAGFYIPESGRIIIGDRDVTRMAPEDRDTGMVFQSYALWPHMTVRQNVAFGLELRKVSKSETTDRVNEALAAVRMTERADYKPNQLSGGQQQRVALARALVIEPQCVLLDEPLSNLDAQLRLEMRTEIRRICKQAGLTAVYVTHDQKEALSVADRLAILHDGVIQQVGAPREVYGAPVNRFVAGFIGETNFVPARIEGVGEGLTRLASELGSIASSKPLPPGKSVGDAVTISIRPEVIGVDNPPDQANRFQGVLHDSIYLGEVAQHLVRIPGMEGNLKVFEINPHIVARDGEVPAEIWVQPDDVLILGD